MNDQLIYEFIAARQPVRAVQLSDHFDVALIEVSEALRSLVDVGDLERKTGTAPNGQPTQMYSLSAAFAKSRDGQLAIARAEAAKAALHTAVAAPASSVAVPDPSSNESEPSDAISTKPIPAPAAVSDINRSKVGLEHIRKAGSATDAELREVMGLRAGQYPSAWLSSAVRSGQINKDGKEWKVGPGQPVRKQPAFGGAISLPGSTPHVVATKDAISKIPLAEASPVATVSDCRLMDDMGLKGEELERAVAAVNNALSGPPKFRVGIWSDGALELQRDGKTVAVLAQREHEEVSAFLDRCRKTEAA